MKLTLLDEASPFTFHWWGGTDEVYERCARGAQPIHVWLGRVAEFLNPEIGAERTAPLVVAEFLARACADAGVAGTAFNQGAWYFGSQVARSASHLTELLVDIAHGGAAPSPRRDRVVVISCGEHKV